ncbi:hypothetical protein BJI67_07300 [Acidihalobacter aeolianus]|uniref:Integrase n=1 Tax=Acidihalobacter aeolianus TaxID=2792603 RepID=A0A1D8K7F2_9GAMM|nr:site-specific integrase [Acidihalobacter aeolianus]AOV16893.1 hypothetical protein BJI67_07300 [Acidihalobacter aeolianus]
MATINQLPSGKWQAKIRRDGVASSKTFMGRADAEAWARRQESEIERGIWRDNTEAERTTLAEALERYEHEVSASKRGKVQESSVIGLLLDSRLAKLTLARIRSADVSALVDDWRAVGYAPATITRRIAILSHVFQTAARSWGMESLSNPVKLVKLPPLRNARERRVTDAEIEAICEATRSPVLPYMIRLAVETAMRRGEIVAIRWSDVHLARRVLHIPQTKNGYPRDVPLSSRALAVLEELKAERDEKRRHRVVPIGKGKAEDDRLFSVRNDVVTQAFERAVVRARSIYEAKCEEEGLRIDAGHLVGLRFHDLRHEATSRLAGPLSVHELAKVTGHRDLRMLMRYYHPSAEDLAAKLG